jgi:hypothetical protein
LRPNEKSTKFIVFIEGARRRAGSLGNPLSIGRTPLVRLNRVTGLFDEKGLAG